MSACHPPTPRTPLATEPNTPYCPINAVDPSGLDGLLIIKARQDHAWIEYKRDGYDKHSYGTWKGGLFVDREIRMGVKAEAYKMTRLNQIQEDNLFIYMNKPKNRKWSYCNNCSSFATGAWQAGTGGDNMPASGICSAGVKTPNLLIESLAPGDYLENPLSPDPNRFGSQEEGGSSPQGSEKDLSAKYGRFAWPIIRLFRGSSDASGSAD